MTSQAQSDIELKKMVRTGTALVEQDDVSLLFEPIQIRGLELQNRIFVSPMGMYSSPDGHATTFHLVHLGSFALRGAGLTFVEATAVSANGRTSPSDNGIWNDSHIPPLQQVVEFVHGIGQKIGIQLAHAGRKSSMMPIVPGVKPRIAGPEDGGWEDNVWGPSALPFADGYPMPVEMSHGQIKEVVEAFAEAARRAVKAGFDAINIHAGHGYLFSNFFSLLTNHRTDEYGGSFTNRVRILVEVIQAIRAVIPDSMPLFVRISATEWMEWDAHQPSWSIEDSIALAKLLPSLGVDLLDVSSGGNNSLQRIGTSAYYQVSLAEQIRNALRKEGIKNLLIGAVGRIDNAQMAKEILEGAKADVVFVGREFLRDPNFVLRTARDSGVKVEWPQQYLRASNW